VEKAVNSKSKVVEEGTLAENLEKGPVLLPFFYIHSGYVVNSKSCVHNTSCTLRQQVFLRRSTVGNNNFHSHRTPSKIPTMMRSLYGFLLKLKCFEKLQLLLINFEIVFLCYTGNI